MVELNNFSKRIIIIGTMVFIFGLFPGGSWDDRAQPFLIVSGILGIFTGAMNVAVRRYKHLVWLDFAVSFALVIVLVLIWFCVIG